MLLNGSIIGWWFHKPLVCYCCSLFPDPPKQQEYCVAKVVEDPKTSSNKLFTNGCTNGEGDGKNKDREVQELEVWLSAPSSGKQQRAISGVSSLLLLLVNQVQMQQRTWKVATSSPRSLSLVYGDGYTTERLIPIIHSCVSRGNYNCMRFHCSFWPWWSIIPSGRFLWQVHGVVYGIIRSSLHL